MNLLPCPFCGHKEPYIVRYGTAYMSTQYECGMCSCSLETSEEWDHGKQWNYRYTEESINMQVRFSIEELNDIRDAVTSHLNHLKRSAEKYNPEIKRLLEKKLD